MRKILHYLAIFLFSIQTFSQDYIATILIDGEEAYEFKSDELLVKKVYEDLISAGSISDPPSIDIVNTEKRPAIYIPNEKKIEIERKVIQICQSFGPDSLNSLAYILAHELAHHVKDHTDLIGYAEVSKNFVDNLSKEGIIENKERSDLNKQVKNTFNTKAESEADIWGGFVAHMAGYNALPIANDFLDSIYTTYNIPEISEKYPTLEERKNMNADGIIKFNELKNIFDIANICLAIGYYDFAIELYDHIIEKEEFKSRELYNNKGLAYIYKALSLKVEQSYKDPFLLPFQIDINSRLDIIEGTKSASSAEKKAIYFFQKAITCFKNASEKDPGYIDSKINLYFAYIGLTILNSETDKSSDLIILSNQIKNNSDFCDFCLDGLNHFSKGEDKKAKKCFKKGSSNNCNICNINLKKEKNNSVINHVNQNKEIDFEGISSEDCFYFEEEECDDYYIINSTKRFSICIQRNEDKIYYKIKKKEDGRLQGLIIVQIENNTYIYDEKGDIKIMNAGVYTYKNFFNENILLLNKENINYKTYLYENYGFD